MVDPPKSPVPGASPPPPPGALSPPSIPSTPPPPPASELPSSWAKAPLRYPNPPDAVNPDPVTLREQWRYATRQYARWYSSAWGTAILTGASFFALGWIIKGGNPLPSRAQEHHEEREK